MTTHNSAELSEWGKHLKRGSFHVSSPIQTISVLDN